MSFTFSIIIPTYNASKTLAATIESILSQTYKSFEVLIIDALSTDNSIEIIRKYNDERIKICTGKDNGVYDAMNKGLKIAEGKYIYFLGSDDFLFDENVLQNIFNSIEKKPCDVLYGNVLHSSNGFVYAGEFTLEKLLYIQNICHQAIFYKKDCFEKLGDYNLQYSLLADWDFNIRCFMHPHFKINFENIVVAVYNDETGLSKDNGESDLAFMKISPHYRMRNILSELSNIKYSKEYGIGKKFYIPLRKIKYLFSK